MRTSTSYQPDTGFQPTPTQLERRTALKRFNRLYVYTPIILLAIVALILVGWLLWLSLPAGRAQSRIFVSALADIVFMLMLCPLMFLCAIVPAGAIGLTFYRRQQRAEQPERADQAGRLHRLLWRVEQLLTRLQVQLEQLADRLAGPVIKLNSWIAAAQAFWNRLTMRSDKE